MTRIVTDCLWPWIRAQHTHIEETSTNTKNRNWRIWETFSAIYHSYLVVRMRTCKKSTEKNMNKWKQIKSKAQNKTQERTKSYANAQRKMRIKKRIAKSEKALQSHPFIAGAEWGIYGEKKWRWEDARKNACHCTINPPHAVHVKANHWCKKTKHIMSIIIKHATTCEREML